MELFMLLLAGEEAIYQNTAAWSQIGVFTEIMTLDLSSW